MSSNRNRLGGKARRAYGFDHKSKQSSRKNSRLSGGGFELLENRTLLAVDTSHPFTNPTNAYDVNADGKLTPVDLLTLVDNLNRYGIRTLLASSANSSSSSSASGLKAVSATSTNNDGVFLDVNGDNEVTPQDALMVINALNNPGPSASITLNIVGLDGDPIPGNTLTQNQYFYVKATATDLISPTTGPNFEGIFSAYMDITYAGSKATPASISTVQFDPAFSISQSNGTFSSGFIDEIGASTNDPAANQPPQTVFYVLMQATGQGAVSFAPSFATGQGHEVFTYSGFDVVPDPTPADPNHTKVVFNQLQASDIQFDTSETLTITAPSANPLPVISISDATVTEGNSGTKNVTFTVTESNNNFDSIVSYATADGTAANNPASGPKDYNATSGQITFAAGGATSKTITLQVRGDTVIEGNENFFVNLFNPFNATVNAVDGSTTDSQGIATIFDDDQKLSITSSVSMAEGNSSTKDFVFTVTLGGAQSVPVTVVFATADGTATVANSDYQATNGTLTFNPGETTKNITVKVNGDTNVEPDETFTVTLSAPVNATITAGAGTGTGTIQNDELAAPTFSIGNASGAEGNASTSAQTFTVTLSQNPAAQVTVIYTTADGTAKTSDSDYQATNGTLTFNPGGSLTQNITVNVVGDTKNEANETYTVTLSGNSVGTGLGTSVGTGTINNDDALPTLSIGGVSQTEGNAGSSTFSFPVTLSAVSGQQVTVVYSTANGTATTGDSDYASANGTLTFAPGETSKNVSVLVNGDTKNEANETFTVGLSGAVNATVLTGTGTGTINNDDAVPSLSITGVSQNEGNSGTTNFVFNVSLSAVSGQTVTVPFSTANGTATAGSDYTATNNILTFNPGETSKQITVSVTGDTTFENNEDFSVTLGTPVNASINVGTATGTILNDDGVPTISITSPSITEGNSGTSTLNFGVTLSAASALPVTVVYATANGTATTADGDYVATNGTLTFNAGETSKQVSVTINGDTKFEANETFSVGLSGATNASISGGTGTGTITNDDTQPSLVVGNISSAEGNAGTTTFAYFVGLSAPSGLTTTVVFSTANGTATTADGDYVATNGTLTFAPGENSKVINLTVNGDVKNEANETFTINFSNPTNASLPTASGTVTITNDDAVPNLSISDVSLAEGNSGTKNFTFNVTLDAASGQQVTVNYATANNTATAGSDYVATSGILTFAPGETSKQITVVVNGDTLSEDTETFNVNLTGPTNAALTKSSGVGSIVNDDAPPGLSISSVALAEGNSGTKTFNFNVALNPASGQQVTVVYTTADGTAHTADSDYVPTTGTLTFAPGDINKTISVVVNGDLVNEADETFTVTLSNPVNTTIASGQGTATGTIQNDDILSLSIDNQSQNEGNSSTSTQTFNVTLSGTSAQTILVPFTTANGTATAGSDYTATAGTLTFNPGETSKQITVSVNGDTTFETDEAYSVNISTAASGVNVTKATGTGAIVNDDVAPTLAISDVSQSEGTVTGGFTDYVFTVTLTGSTALPVTVGFTTADGTAITGNGANGHDYQAQSGTLTFAPGETSKQITVKVRADKAFENDETFNVNLVAGATNATITDGTGTGTIVNDDPVGSLDVSSLAGYVFVDTNNNGTMDAPEKPLAGVIIMIDGESDAAGTVHYETTTAADGSYKFENLDPGDYTLTEVQPGFYLDGAQHVGTQGSTSSTNDTISFRLEGGVDATGNIFAERGLRGEFITRRLLLASTPHTTSAQSLLSSLDVSPSPMWISIDGGYTGTLTAQSQASGGTAQLTLYDNNLQQLTTSATGADARIDWNGVPGAPYFLKVTGTSHDVDVTLTNLVSESNGVVTVKGTDGDDSFVFDATSATPSFSINGVKYELNPANTSQVVFDGGKGYDTATLNGSTAADTAHIALGLASLSSARYNVQATAEAITVNGGGGNDVATLVDSAFDDRLTGQDDWLTLANDFGFEATARGFARVSAQSSHGGHDVDAALATDFALELAGNWA